MVSETRRAGERGDARTFEYSATAGAVRRFKVIDEHLARPAYEAVVDVRPALLVAWAWRGWG